MLYSKSLKKFTVKSYPSGIPFLKESLDPFRNVRHDASLLDHQLENPYSVPMHSSASCRYGWLWESLGWNRNVEGSW